MAMQQIHHHFIHYLTLLKRINACLTEPTQIVDHLRHMFLILFQMTYSNSNVNRNTTIMHKKIPSKSPNVLLEKVQVTAAYFTRRYTFNFDINTERTVTYGKQVTTLT